MKSNPLFSRRVTGSLLVLAAAMLWGTTGTSQALAPVGASPLAVGALRMVVGGMALLGVAGWRGSLRDGLGQGWRWRPTLLAALCMAAYNVFFFEGVSRAGVAVGTIVGIGSAPIFGGILGFWLHREPPTMRWATATLLAIAGAVLLVFPAAGRTTLAGEAGQVYWGVVLAVGAGFVYALYVALSKRLLENHPADKVLAVVFSIGGLMLLPALLQRELNWLAQPQGLAVALWLGVMATALAYSLFAQGLRLTTVGTATTLTLAEPLTAGLLGLVVVGEQISGWGGWLGIGLLFAGLALLTVQREDH